MVNRRPVLLQCPAATKRCSDAQQCGECVYLAHRGYHIWVCPSCLAKEEHPLPFWTAGACSKCLKDSAVLTAVKSE